MLNPDPGSGFIPKILTDSPVVGQDNVVEGTAEELFVELFSKISLDGVT
jgi:hypothetical protein